MGLLISLHIKHMKRFFSFMGTALCSFSFSSLGLAEAAGSSQSDALAEYVSLADMASLELAAQGGDIEAQCRLGEIYYSGQRDMERNPVPASKCQ